jgi:hypothetical protein
MAGIIHVMDLKEIVMQMMNFYGQDTDYKLDIDTTDQRLIELLLKGYTSKKIALHERMPLRDYPKIG